MDDRKVSTKRNTFQSFNIRKIQSFQFESKININGAENHFFFWKKKESWYSKTLDYFNGYRIPLRNVTLRLISWFYAFLDDAERISQYSSYFVNGSVTLCDSTFLLKFLQNGSCKNKKKIDHSIILLWAVLEKFQL